MTSVSGAGVRRGPGELAEDEATGLAAECYERLRMALGADFVPTVFRMLGRHERLLDAGVSAVLDRLGADDLERLAAGARGRAALAARRLSGAPLTAGRDTEEVGALLTRYNTVNPRGIVFVLALRGPVDRPLTPVMCAASSPRRAELLEDVRASHGGLTVPGLWRELDAGWPAVAEPAWELMRPLAGSPELSAARRDIRAPAREAVAGIPAPDPRALGCDAQAQREIEEILDWFAAAIPALVVEIEILRDRLGAQ